MHPTKDLAVIILNHPNQKQAFCRLILTECDYRSFSVDTFGIHKDTHDRDEAFDYTVGSLESAEDCYCFDHAVKPGFSGGAVAVHGQQKIIGIILKRDRAEQESLFFPFYCCKDWLKKLHGKFPDAGLAEYFSAGEQKPSDLEIKQCIRELARFIGRPRDAFKHVFDEVRGARARVKACFCVYSNYYDDQPEDFAISMAVRLMSDTMELDYKTLEAWNERRWEAKSIRVNPWDIEKKDDFFAQSLTAICKNLKIPDAVEGGSPDKINAEQRQRILAGLSVRKSPLVLYSEVSEKPVKLAWYRFSKPIGKIEKRFEWISEFNQQWRNHIEQQGGDIVENQPLVLLFCLQVPNELAEKTQKRCFKLGKISAIDLKQWFDEVSILLSDSPLYDRNAVVEQIKALKNAEFKEAFGKDRANYALTYPSFYKLIKDEPIQHRKVP